MTLRHPALALFSASFVLCLGACVPQHRQARLGILAPKKADAPVAVAERTPTPTPAPALYIPGPASSMPAGAVLQTPAQPKVVAQAGTPQAGAPLPLPPLPLPPLTPKGPEAPPLPPKGSEALPAPLPPIKPVGLTVPEAAPTSGVAAMRALHTKAAQRFATMDSYICRMRRREVVGSSNRPEEVLLCKFRREPWSVYFKWLGNEGKDREVVYVKGRYDNQIHTLTASWDIPLVPAGRRIKVGPDSVLVRSKSRYPITEAGFGPLIVRFGKLVDALEKNDAREGSAKYLGLLKRPEFDDQVEGVLQVLPPKSDPLLARGGQRLWFFDRTWNLPVLIITHDDAGREVEYYCNDRIQHPVQLDDDDFNPDVLWKSAS